MERRLRAFFFLLLVALLLPTPPAAAQNRWMEVRSPNFTVYTDSGERDGREVALRFEQMRAIFGMLFQKARVQSDKPTLVLAFRNRRDVRSVSRLYEGKPVELAGFFQPSEGANYIVIDMSARDRWRIVFHELAHLLLNANASETQLWFDEGFAEFFSTVEVQRDRFTFGAVPEGVPIVLQRQRMLPVTELFAVGHGSRIYSVGQQKQVFYAQSWLAMHYLWSLEENRQRLAAYFNLIERREPLETAIRKGFGVEPRELDKELERHYRTGRVTVRQGRMPPGLENLELSTRPLDELDARAVVADLRLQSPDHWEQGMREMEEVVTARSEHPVGQRGLGYAWLRKGDLDRAAKHFQRAAELDSRDPRVHYLSATLLMRMGAASDGEMRARMRASLRRAVELDPQFADAHHWLGMTHFWDDEVEDAVNHLAAAVTLSPRNEQFAMVLANAHMRRHDWDAARIVLGRLANSSDEHIRHSAGQMLDSLERMKDALARSSAPLPAGSTPSMAFDPYDDDDLEEDDDEEEPGSGRGERPLRFFSGTLIGVECSPPHRATFTVIGGNDVLQLAAADLREVAWNSKEQFSCAWRDLKVQGFYRREKGRSELVALQVDE